ncbi:hypothetical protein AA100600_2657 [Gluconobacter thailandicus F149-1 = NBRC 100600]|nr:hypothetical protein AA100600_2657 [Gluconobacter thailandicus F149-1 = NBRC 100600]
MVFRLAEMDRGKGNQKNADACKESLAVQENTNGPCQEACEKHQKGQADISSYSSP